MVKGTSAQRLGVPDGRAATPRKAGGVEWRGRQRGRPVRDIVREPRTEGAPNSAVRTWLDVGLFQLCCGDEEVANKSPLGVHRLFGHMPRRVALPCQIVRILTGVVESADRPVARPRRVERLSRADLHPSNTQNPVHTASSQRHSKFDLLSPFQNPSHCYPHSLI
jgi:hypothetical protein